MKKIVTLFAVLAAVAVLAPATLRAEEDLFDTKTALQHLVRGLTYLQAKKYDAAIREFEASAEINPDAEAYYYLGYAYYLKSRKGDGENRSKSRENFERAYEIDPNFSPTRLKPAEQVPAAEEHAAEPAEPAPLPATSPTPSGPQPEQPAPPAEPPK
jgi:tetratricopeptide (TPR) repeat protein